MGVVAAIEVHGTHVVAQPATDHTVEGRGEQHYVVAVGAVTCPGDRDADPVGGRPPRIRFPKHCQALRTSALSSAEGAQATGEGESVHDDRGLTEARLERVFRERIIPAIYPRTTALSVEVWHAAGEPVRVDEALASPYVAASVGDSWGRPWGTSWFRFTGRVPEDWARQTVEAVIDLGFDGPGPGFTAEGMAYGPDGHPLKGLHPRNMWVPIRRQASGGEAVEFFVEAAANPQIIGPVTPLGDPLTAGDEPLYHLARADLATFDEVVWNLSIDLQVLGELMHELPVSDPRRWEILRAIERALDALDLDGIPATAEASRAALSPALTQSARASAHRISAVGHAHIDSAWLWPIRETVRKVARTASNVVNLMDDHPELIFAMSQAQQFAWLAENRPEVYGRVAKKVADGQFVPVGGMWVEADTNMPGGEAMARQLIHGKRFFRERFGIDTQEVWLPDSFGYSAALPQLIKLSGSRWFLTQKLSWSQTNAFPHHTFWWEGIDGTRIFTHLPPVDTYNAELTGEELSHAVANFREKGKATRSMVPFGHGDGGGGPTREMLARARRLHDLDGSPRVTIEAPADFFAQAEHEYDDAPVWVGELYLEYHRGTYTSQAKTKRGNRRSEHLLREAELWASTAAVHQGSPYPHDALDRIWKTVLLQQFHDILPGSSIAWVHRQAQETYEAVETELQALIADAQAALAGNGDGQVVFNAAPHERAGIPAGGVRVAFDDLGPETAVTVIEEGKGWVLDNELVRVKIDEHGLITSVYDRVTDREAIPPGEVANLLQIHPDLPNRWDAWDIDAFYRTTVTHLSSCDGISVATARDRSELRIERSFGSSKITQHVGLSPRTRCVEIETEVDWYETEKILKVAFPIDIRAETSAAETQFGHVHRPTHTNTTWDAAKFEICAHRFLHLAEPSTGLGAWGATIVNDSVYGHDVTRTIRKDGGTTTTARLSLLRAPRFPDPATDHGTHRFRFALVPGTTITDAVKEGYRINLPERRMHGSADVRPLVTLDDDRVVIEAVKLADDRSGDLIIRLYEATGARAKARLHAGFTVASVAECDLLEAPSRAIEHSDNTVPMELRPFEIRTLRLER